MSVGNRATMVAVVAGTVAFGPVPAGQSPAPPAPTGQASAARAPAAGESPAFPQISLVAGRSTVVPVSFDVTRIAVTNPAVADAVVVAPREVLVDGKSPGTVSLIVWGSGSRIQYDVIVDPGITVLQQQLQSLFPGEDIEVKASEESIILSGHVSSNTVMLRAGEIAAASASKAKVINLLQLPGGSESQQVLLQVRFAEVNRHALAEMGASFFADGYKNYFGRSTTQQFAAPVFDKKNALLSDLVFSDYLNLFVLNGANGLGALLRALKTRGYLQSLAEPNLIAYNGQEASFLAGGEIPIPVVQGVTGMVTIVFKEFGIRLNFTPTIAGDMIRLRVRPEVSTLDFPNGITLAGFRIPALSTRRAETDVELRDGQSFAIAGLLDNISQEDRSAVPMLASLPIIGNFFKSKAENATRTELMVLITPRLVRPLDPDEVPPLPTLIRPFPGQELGGELEGGGGTMDAPAVEGQSGDTGGEAASNGAAAQKPPKRNKSSH